MSDDIEEVPPLASGWAVLMKFGQREHLEALRSDGLLHMNPQAYFAKIEKDTVRRDPFEGTDRIYPPVDVKRLVIKGPADAAGTIKEIVITSADLAGPLSVTLTTTHRYNLFCMYGLAAPLAPPFVDERNFQFGDSFILILNTQAFLDRACAAIEAAGFGREYRFVTHYDPVTHSGETGVFRKPRDFAYQKEFRIAVWPGLIEPLQLRIGDLTDITSPILPLAEINQIVDFGEESPQATGIPVP
jgi:hypothetical protein